VAVTETYLIRALAVVLDEQYKNLTSLSSASEHLLLQGSKSRDDAAPATRQRSLGLGAGEIELGEGIPCEVATGIMRLFADRSLITRGQLLRIELKKKHIR